MLLPLFTLPACDEEPGIERIERVGSIYEDEAFAEEREAQLEGEDDPEPWKDGSLDLTAPASNRVDVACTQDNDCRSSCDCDAGTCVPPSGISPNPPAGYCDTPPSRSCSSALDCRDGCSCAAGTCQPSSGVGPHPACHLPPPDEYEDDDTWPNYSAYSGPQRHNFDHASDSDWVGVHIPHAGTVRFETTGLTQGTDTRLEVYAWDGNRGALLGADDDVGGWFFDPNSKRSIVDLDVSENASFLIRVRNDSRPSMFVEEHRLPTYTLRLRYL